MQSQGGVQGPHECAGEDRTQEPECGGERPQLSTLGALDQPRLCDEELVTVFGAGSSGREEEML